MSKIDNINQNCYYVNRTKEDAEIGFLVASATSGAIMSALPLLSKPFTKQIEKEQINNSEYKKVFQKVFQKTGLKESYGLELVNAAFNTADISPSVIAGKNAYFSPSTREVVLNLEKASASGFHELGHALNYFGNKFTRFLQKTRGGCYALAGYMGTVALLSRKKPKEAKKNLSDFIQDNAGLIAFGAMLPVVAEETLASYRGVKLAKKAGLNKKLLGNLKKLYGKALLTYAGRAALVGLSVHAAAKITEHYTRPKKITLENKNYI